MARAKQRQGAERAQFDAVVEIEVGYRSGRATLKVVSGEPLRSACKNSRSQRGGFRGQTQAQHTLGAQLSAHLSASTSKLARPFFFML